MLTKIDVWNIEGERVLEVETAIVEKTRDHDRSRAVIWNGRVFVAVDIPDCDAPEHYLRSFEEVNVLAVVDGDEQALAEQIEQLAQP